MIRLRVKEWKDDILHHKYKILLSLLFLILAFAATVISSNYVDNIPTVTVPDLILDVLPVINLSFLYVWGIVLIITILLAYPLFFQPKKFHYVLGILSLFLVVRSGFIILTHLKAPLGAINVALQSTFSIITYSNDLFFSGHVGIPFLGFLIYKNRKVKYFFLIASIILAITVLLMHVHYSIDVLSAYFITYGIYKIGDFIFGNKKINLKRS